MAKLLRKTAVMAPIMLTITGVLTSVMTLWNLPDGKSFLEAWVPTWLFTALVMAPIGFTMFWLVGRAYDRLLPQLSYNARAIMQGATMAAVMESFMAASATYQLNGFEAGFASIWFSNVMVSLPVALVLSAIMSVALKPRLDRLMAA